jgi:hypothetical protein
MKIYRSIAEPIRKITNWDELWKDTDKGLICSWEQGRNKSLEDPELASKARDGQLMTLVWKGGTEKALKINQKYGSLHYLAMWLGLRGEDLAIDTDACPTLTCTKTQMNVIFTDDINKLNAA